MKKRMASIVLCMLLLICCCTEASAAQQNDPGFYRIGQSTVLIEPLSASEQSVTAERFDADGDGEEEEFYPCATMLRVTVPNAVPGRQYLIQLLDTKSNDILFVDQAAGGRKLCFRVSFLLPDQQTELKLIIGSDADGFEAVAVPLYYTPGASAQEPAPEEPEPHAPSEPEDPEPHAPSEPEDPEPAAPSEQKSGYAACPRDKTCVMAHFSDLDAAAWYHDGVHWALENGVMNGMRPETFAPDVPVSRAMLVTMLWRQAGKPAASGQIPFTDVMPGRWYTEAVRWAAERGIVKGYNAQTFGPDDAITREQISVILRRYASMQGDMSPGGADQLGQYLDADQIAPWALDAMRWAVHAGLIQGVSDELLGPKDGATRAQAATLLIRFSAPMQD